MTPGELALDSLGYRFESAASVGFHKVLRYHAAETDKTIQFESVINNGMYGVMVYCGSPYRKAPIITAITPDEINAISIRLDELNRWCI